MLVASGSGWMTGNSDVMGQGGLPAGQKSASRRLPLISSKPVSGPLPSCGQLALVNECN
jgi:hypothetical protein